MSFLKDIRLVFLLFILGDTATTIYALQTGLFYEGNPIMSKIFDMFGYLALIPLKIAFMFLLYYVYRNADSFYWDITRYVVSGIGFLTTINNMVVVLHG